MTVFQSPSERGLDFRVPQLAVMVHGELVLFLRKEEYLCACELEKWATRGRIDFWVRNLVRKPCSSFYLQTAEGRFYPDFVCRLPDKTILVVEYKGADRYAAARMDRDMGELWAELSDGRCRFVMATDKKCCLLYTSDAADE